MHKERRFSRKREEVYHIQASPEALQYGILKKFDTNPRHPPTEGAFAGMKVSLEQDPRTLNYKLRIETSKWEEQSPLADTHTVRPDEYTYDNTVGGITFADLEETMKLCNQPFVDEDGKPVGLQKEPESTTIDTTMNLPLKELKNTVVHVPTKAEYDLLMHIYEAAGWKSLNGFRPTERNGGGTYVYQRIKNGFDGYIGATYDNAISLKEFLDRQDLELIIWSNLGEAAIGCKGKLYSSFTRKSHPEIFKLMVRMHWKEEECETREEAMPSKKIEDYAIIVSSVRDKIVLRDALQLNGYKFHLGGGYNAWLSPHEIHVTLCKSNKTFCVMAPTCPRTQINADLYSIREFFPEFFEQKKPFWKKMGFGQYSTREEMEKARVKEMIEYVSKNIGPLERFKKEKEQDPRFISLPKFPMGEHTCAGTRPSKPLLQKVRDSRLNPDEQVLRKQGFKNSCGDWTEDAYAVAAELLCEEKRKELIEKAKELEKLDKENKKDCC